MNLNEAEKMALQILQTEVLHDWSFRFDRAKKRFGQCNYLKKEISLSRYLVELNTEEKVKDTIIHEVAHAIAGYESGHGKIWKQCVVRMGGVPERCYSPQEVNTPKLKYTVFCESCDLEIQKTRKPKKSLFKTAPACKNCCQKYNNGKFSRKFLLQYREN